MSRKNVLNYELAAGQSLSASFNTPATIVKFLDNCSYQINVTTTNSVGTFAVQVSNDYEAIEGGNGQTVITNAGTWDALTLSGTPSVAGANDSIVIDLRQLPFHAMRLAYTASTPGTGIADIFVHCKQVGA